MYLCSSEAILATKHLATISQSCESSQCLRWKLVRNSSKLSEGILTRQQHVVIFSFWRELLSADDSLSSSRTLCTRAVTCWLQDELTFVLFVLEDGSFVFESFSLSDCLFSILCRKWKHVIFSLSTQSEKNLLK